MPLNAQQQWNMYVEEELHLLSPVLQSLGYTLDQHQPHIKGERYLMQALTSTSGKKLILFVTRADGQRAVCKATRDRAGAKEIRYEQVCRRAIHTLPFAYLPFKSPTELFFGVQNGFTVSIQEFIEQECSFLERPLSEQFSFSLSALKAQEGAHAATYEQQRHIYHLFGRTDTRAYLSVTSSFAHKAQQALPEREELLRLIRELEREITTQASYISQYENFLTHTDFVPHNFRIKEGTLYLLDYASLRFGNKHEGWARFLNFMTLYNPDLETAFEKYFLLNRSSEERESLRTMRLYRLCEILWYYVQTLSRSEGTLRELNEERIKFWSSVAYAQLSGVPLEPATREAYIETRDRLRSPDEQIRQQGLH